MIQNYTLDERKNEVNGSNNEINQSDILLTLFSQGLKNVNFQNSWEILLCDWGGGIVLTHIIFFSRGDRSDTFLDILVQIKISYPIAIMRFPFS